MRARPKMILGVLALGAAGVGAAIWIGSRRQQHLLAADVERLIQSAPAQVPETHPETHPLDFELENLPPPVGRYLRLVLREPKRIQRVTIRQTGTVRTDVKGRWMSFEADHIAVPPATGFVWNARVRIAPLLHVRVRDMLIGGQGAGQVALLSAFVVGGDGGTPEMNSGSLHRYLAEAVWYPTALLPGPKLEWTEIDARRALATLTDRGVTVSLEFRFSESGEVSGIYTPGRWGTFPEGYRQVPWEGHFRNYREFDGILVPTEADVGWYVDNEWHAVWKGSVTALEVE